MFWCFFVTAYAGFYTIDVKSSSYVFRNIEPGKYKGNDNTNLYSTEHTFIFTGATNSHNIHFFGHHPEETILIEFKNLNVKLPNTPFITFTGIANIVINISTNVNIDCNMSNVIEITDDANLTIIGSSTESQVATNDGYNIVSGKLASINLENLKMKSQNNGIKGKEIHITNSSLTNVGAIGGPNYTKVVMLDSEVNSQSKGPNVGGITCFSDKAVIKITNSKMTCLSVDDVAIGGSFKK